MDKSPHCWYLLRLNSNYNKGQFRVSGFPSVWPINCPYEGFFLGVPGCFVTADMSHRHRPNQTQSVCQKPQATWWWAVDGSSNLKSRPCCRSVDGPPQQFDLNGFAFAFIEQKCNHWREFLKRSITKSACGMNEGDAREPHWRQTLLLSLNVRAVSMLPVMALCCNQKVCTHTEESLLYSCAKISIYTFFFCRKSHDLSW